MIIVRRYYILIIFLKENILLNYYPVLFTECGFKYKNNRLSFSILK
ncbi:hypothetical protein BVAVS116_E0029 (plasmid) [Borreliella valaisiana VS116]|uniref:Uncharacterized protein n=1 Tax=Borreliella valaisiana VS116 TaxID=445987 RepID=C0R8R0_BORVA|nr:hypothetical protein BVAVS116_E0029 [Borreliella valaisiana VS116]